jgi:hypothetical protein
MAGRNSQQTRILHSATGSAATYVELEDVTQISGPNGTANIIDVTDLRSTAKESLPGLADYGQIQVTMNYTGGTEQVALYDMFATNADPEAFKIAMPTSAAATTFDVLSFNGSITQCTFGMSVDDKQTLQVTIKTDGAVTLTQSVASGALNT